MKIICTVKYVPDVDKFQFDFEKNVVVRHNIRMILNPDDTKAVGLALAMKKSDPKVKVEVLCMGPKSVLPMAKDLIRMGVDQVTLLSDARFVGSDSYITSKILGTYLYKQKADLILTGSHSLDGDTSHVPSQVADFLSLPHMTGVTEFHLSGMEQGRVEFTSENELKRIRFSMKLPGILSLSKDAKYKLPYIRYEDVNLNVDQFIQTLTLEDLDLDIAEVGLQGSLTKVKRTFVKEYKLRNQEVIGTDEDGIERIYQFLKNNGYIGGKKYAE
ncbi:electron transfer flavoprotein subunit beta/FixA family protein [Proteiniclasticum ruminis]|uniref:Electron transfer flavoprotein small subunit n=1 Tax=Proteiniclasticum ruminis TaxID=398199 RepID=A0A1G8JXK8_9CLOT|nr:electron transfer flavoprotein subunit beta/FixA family protein [Proteiniclasticum ruminis]SDI35895.1 electron transfer flavoprotein beta subunit [Proteiniclasticum ruminis]